MSDSDDNARSTDWSRQLAALRISPRNLSARADTANRLRWIRGNPVSSRPEAGVGNTTPGLELDERGLDKYFFPGLVFEFQWNPGWDNPDVPRAGGRVLELPLLRSVDQNRLLNKQGPHSDGFRLEGSDPGSDDTDRRLFLCMVSCPDDRWGPLNFLDARFDTERGLRFWRGIRYMPPGDVRLLIASGRTVKNWLERTPRGPTQQVITRLYSEPESVTDPRQWSESMPLSWAIVIGKTLEYLDPETGVIDTELVPPGELQATMCTPWQYDFRDCKCYYWAANRPDLVSTGDRDAEPVNFLRRDRKDRRLPIDQDEWVDDMAFNHVEALNDWERLPVVLEDREVTYVGFDLHDRLIKLAQIEHAVAIEYLYGYYTIDDKSGDVARYAAEEMLSMATDEMRHFRYVNQILTLLEKAPEIGRAKDYGPNFNHRPFSLSDFTQDTLEWFMRIEKPSQMLKQLGQLDGMYVRILDMFESNAGAFPHSERLIQYTKLIIDEGGDHYERLLELYRRMFEQSNAGQYLLLDPRTPPTRLEELALEISDTNYHALLLILSAVFALDDAEDGSALGTAVRCMIVLNGLNRQLARRRQFPKFKLPAGLNEDLVGFARNVLVKVNEHEAKLSELEKDMDNEKEKDEMATKARECLACIQRVPAQVKALVASYPDRLSSNVLKKKGKKKV